CMENLAGISLVLVRRGAMAANIPFIRSHVRRLISICVGIVVLVWPPGGWGDESLRDPPRPRPDDWITINKNYSSQRYVDLDQISPKNVNKLKEVCEIQLNEPVYFNSGIVKVGRTLYTTTFRGTYAFDAVTCSLRWRHVIEFKYVPAGLSN